MKKKRETLIIGLITFVAGILLIVCTLTSGAFYSVLTLNRVDNAVYVKGLVSQEKIAGLGEVKSFKSKPEYRKTFFFGQGALCYNLELTKVRGAQTEVFPFCISNYSRMHTIEREVNSFMKKPVSMHFKISLFSTSNLIWFCLALFALCIGGLLIRRGVKK